MREFEMEFSEEFIATIEELYQISDGNPVSIDLPGLKVNLEFEDHA